MNDKRERIERGMRLAARIVSEYGPVYLPIFERLEREHAKFKSADNALERARQIAGHL